MYSHFQKIEQDKSILVSTTPTLFIVSLLLIERKQLAYHTYAHTIFCHLVI